MKKIATMILMIFAVTSCASIVNGPRQMVKITSNITNASIKIYDSKGTLVSEGRGDLTTSLKRARDKFEGENYIVKVTSPSGETKSFGINSELSLWYPIGNAAFGGIPGWIIDSFSEAKYKLRTTEGKNPSNGIKVEF